MSVESAITGATICGFLLGLLFAMLLLWLFNRAPDRDADVITRAENAIGWWLAAALDDPAVCDEMKADIRQWFSAREGADK